MKRNILWISAIALMSFTMMTSCSNDDVAESAGTGKSVVTAKALLGEVTRVAYTDPYTGAAAANITAAWESTDKLNVLGTTNGITTASVFTNSEISGNSATFISTDATVPRSATMWKAVLGGKASVSKDTITCSYDGQNGTLANLTNYDYMVATGTGISPTFDFTSGSTSSTRLTYFLRLKVPAGVRYVEFCSGTWTITGDANTSSAASTSTVDKVDLGSNTTEAKIIYLAVPAINYFTSGLILTILSADGSKSEGKVISQDFSAKGGYINTYDMSGVKLIDRPTTSIDLGKRTVGTTEINLGKWAPYNVGAMVVSFVAPETYGDYYAWGSTEIKYLFPWSSYMCAKTDCGTVTADPICIWDGKAYNTQTPVDISGSKFDVARVKWGKGWRMPTEVQLKNLRGIVKWESNYTYMGVSEVEGFKVTNNSATVFLPAAGYGSPRGALDTRKYGVYWASTQSVKYARSAWNLALYEDYYDMGYTDRCVGQSVRAVAE